MKSNEKIYFWSTIMRDHAEFMLLTLSSRETEFVERAKIFKNIFIEIGNEVTKLNDNISDSFINSIFTTVTDFINYKLEIIRRLLLCDIEINLPPTFINHMVNEAMEFIRTLQDIKTKVFNNPIAETIMLHKIWLPDAAGHAAGIASDLDPTETTAIKEAERFKEAFNNLFIKATELGIMLERTGLNDGSLTYLSEEVIERINEFIVFLNKVMVLRTQCKLLGTLNPLLPNHMIREEQYYLDSILRLSNRKTG